MTERLVASGHDGIVELLRGATTLASGDPAAARAPLRLAAVRRPHDPRAQYLHGVALHDLGDVDGALVRFRLALALPGAGWTVGPEIAKRLRAASQDEGDSARRQELLSAAVQANPRDADAAEALHTLLRSSGEDAAAARVLAQLLRRSSLPSERRRRMRLLTFEAHMSAGDLHGMTDHLQSLMRDEEQDAVLSLTLQGVLRIQIGDPHGAESLLRDAVAREPETLLPTLALVEALIAQRDFAEARTAVGAWSDLHPGDHRLRDMLTRVLARHGALDEAHDEVAELIGRAGADLVRLRQYVWIEVLRGRPESALEIVDNAVAAGTGEAQTGAVLLRGEVLLQALGRVDDAASVARGVLNAEGASPLNERRALMLSVEARLHTAGEQATSAAAVLLRRLKRGGTSAGERSLTARIAFADGLVAYRRERLTTARDRFRACLEADPSHAGAANNLAWLLAKTPGRQSEAVQLAELATRLAPRNAEHWQTLGACLSAMSRHRDAVAALTRTLGLLEDAPAAREDAVAETLVLRAEAHLLWDHGSAARADAERALTLAKRADLLSRARRVLEAD